MDDQRTSKITRRKRTRKRDVNHDTLHTNNILPEIHQFSHVEPSQQPAPDINKFSKLETIFIVPPEKTKVDDGVMQHLINTVIQENRRYQVAWLGNENISLPENYELSYGRMKSLHKRIVEVPIVLREYDSLIKEQLEKGIMERVDKKSEEGKSKHYILHFTAAKDTTKVRIMYLAFAKTKKKINLIPNDLLYRGPVILDDLCGFLLRYRMKKTGVVADIEKTFLQVALQPKERDVTRFLWLKDLKQPVSPSNLVTY